MTGPDLVTWLRQQLDADEAVVRRNLGTAGLGDDGTFPDYRTYVDDDTVAAGDYLEVFRPPRLLAEVAARRRILDLHVTLVRQEPRPPFDPMTGESQGPQVDVYCEVCGWVADDPPCACETVRLLALPFAGRAGYRPEWHPDHEGDDDADHH